MSELPARLRGRLRRSFGGALRAPVRQAVKTVSSDVTTALEGSLSEVVRSEMRELARMLRQQGDADDELAETLGRELVRLSAEVEALAEVVGRLAPPPDGPGGDRQPQSGGPPGSP